MTGSAFAEIVRSTPNTLRAIIVLVLLFVLIVTVVVAAIAALAGQKVQAWVLQIEEYRAPDVQKCSLLVAGLPDLRNLNTDAINTLSSQITQLTGFVSANQARANEINNSAGYAAVADRFRGEASEFQKQIDELRARQNEIIQNRQKIVIGISERCLE